MVSAQQGGNREDFEIGEMLFRRNRHGIGANKLFDRRRTQTFHGRMGKVAWVQTVKTLRAPLRLSSPTAATSVPAVSTSSSTRIASLSATSPITVSPELSGHFQSAAFRQKRAEGRAAAQSCAPFSQTRGRRRRPPALEKVLAGEIVTQDRKSENSSPGMRKNRWICPAWRSMVHVAGGAGGADRGRRGAAR